MRDRTVTMAMRGLAERQHGVVAHRQLLELGVGAEAVRSRREGGLLIPVFQGVYAVGYRRLGRESRWMAAVLACGPGGGAIPCECRAPLWPARVEGSR